MSHEYDDAEAAQAEYERRHAPGGEPEFQPFPLDALPPVMAAFAPLGRFLRQDEQHGIAVAGERPRRADPERPEPEQDGPRLVAGEVVAPHDWSAQVIEPNEVRRHRQRVELGLIDV